ncbi:MAG: efflux RND transporter periplasmic adaptor subunit [Bacteroidota bacterium]|nr:efflux RND transporter periplasmic adaptor subunit [Bacteroidota bacterium]
MNKKKIFILVGVAILLIAITVVSRSKKPKDAQIFTKVQKGEFEVLVAVTGELEAMNKENIIAPPELMSDMVRVYQVKIQDLIPEGSVVDSGEYVATLDKTDITTRLREVQDDLDRQKSNYIKTQLDTTIQLRDLRDQIQNLGYDREEKQIALDQSKYEPPATIRQAQIALDKAKRDYENSKKNYKLKVRQADANMRDAEFNMRRPERRIEEINKVMDKFVITAPKRGMLIYAKERRGDKRKVGSTVSAWDNTVATLPDLSVMISKTYVSEIDINQIKVGQKVRLGVDAFPDKKYTGEVIKVSNVGEQMQGSDTKVFEVIIRINGSDPVLRPYMTTSNSVVINKFKDVTYIPIDAIHNEDSIPFVYKKDGVKQIVLLGTMNDNQVIIEKGLKSGEDIYLGTPEKPEKFKKEGQELIPLIKAKEAKRKKEKEEMERQKEKEERAKREIKMQQPGGSPQGGVPQRNGGPSGPRNMGGRGGRG